MEIVKLNIQKNNNNKNEQTNKQTNKQKRQNMFQPACSINRAHDNTVNAHS